jgi:hypothetical protein
MTKKIAAITMARNDEFFLGRWIEYYGAQIGHENLYICLDGTDQVAPQNAVGAHIIHHPHIDNLSRAAGDRHRIQILSNLARDLFASGYEIIIGCDADEFLVVDPNTNMTLSEYLSTIKINTSVSGLGLDVGMDLNRDETLDESKPFLAQRDYALLSTRYTKPVVINRPVRWGSGFHSIKHHNFHIDKNLFLFHFGSVDYEMIRAKVGVRNSDWKKHLARRADTIFQITRARRRNASLKSARLMQTVLRPIYALGKPAMLGLKRIVKIPKRFKEIV